MSLKTHPRRPASRATSTALTDKRFSARARAKLARWRRAWARRWKRPAVRRMLVFVPGLIMMVVTAFTYISPRNPDIKEALFWTPAEFGMWVGPLVAGAVWINYSAARAARATLAEARRSEEVRRAVAAIGVAANWDLDLERLYRRVSHDLRSVISFDRLAITAAQPDGRMRVEFVFGPEGEGIGAGDYLPAGSGEPDGLSPTALAGYGSRLTVPVAACSGTLTIRSRQAGAYTAAHADLLRQAVAQISPGIANALHYRSSRRQVEERTALAAIGRSANSEQELHLIFETVESSLSRLISFDHLGVILATEQSDTGVIAYWSAEGLLGRYTGDMLTIDIKGGSKTDFVRGLGYDPLGLAAGGLKGEDAGRTWLQAPLVVHENLIGMIVISSLDSAGISAEEAALLQNVSLQVAPAIQNAVLTEHLKQRSDERRAIAAIGLAANYELDLDAIYERVADELAQVVPYDRLVVLYSSPGTELLEVGYVRGIEVEGQGVGDRVMATERADVTYVAGKPVATDREEHRQPGHTAAQSGAGLKSWTQVPLGAGPQHIGFLSVHSREEFAYDSRTVDFLERVADQVAPAIRNARMLAAERELRGTLDRQNRELQEANSARKQFLSTVSHELKTPLTIISGFIDLLMTDSRKSGDEEQLETLEIMRRNANHLSLLINDLLDISRLDAGTFKLNKSPFCMNGLVEEIEESFGSVVVQKDQRLSVQGPQEEVWINADRTRIAQVISNLVSNASKYSPEGTEIEIHCGVEGKFLRLAVIDHGIGIPEAEQASLFTAFFRVDNETTRMVSGTGLGLVIAKSIVELHGGEVRLESRPGEGTKIEFWLPGMTTAEEKGDGNANTVVTGSRLWHGRGLDELEDELELGAD